MITLGQISSGVRIFKGPRLKSENLIVENPGEGIEPYYTPSAVLQEKSDSAKLLNVAIASAKQIATINAVRVYRGDIVITRSGTIGRVAYITKRLNGAIVSDDLIRVRIPDEGIRNYALQFLQSDMALNQMLKNEYGAVQQHLEPNHVSDILIPIPANWADADQLIENVRNQLLLKEALEDATSNLDKDVCVLISGLIDKARQKNA